MSVTFASKCYEKDWFRMIVGFKEKQYACQYPFDASILVINNVKDLESVQNALSGVADTLVSAERSIQRILSSFNLLETPNVYALGELAAVLSCQTPYLCYVQGDCRTVGGDWVSPGLAILEAEPNVMVVSPASEVNTWHNADGYDHYMSDQTFLIRTADFMLPEVYTVAGVDTDYPGYGGNSFEAMVGKYLKASNRTRKIIPHAYTLHPTY